MTRDPGTKNRNPGHPASQRWGFLEWYAPVMRLFIFQRNKKHQGAGFISADWKNYIGKTLVTLALTGVGSLMFVSGNFLLNVIPKLQTTISPLVILAKEEGERAKRHHELAASVMEVYQRRKERFARTTEFLESNMSQPDLARLSDLVDKNSEEAAHDSGLLSGFTTETTGLPVTFHESLHGFSQMEVDFWHSFSAALDATRKNPKTGREKILELHGRLPNMV